MKNNYSLFYLAKKWTNKIVLIGLICISYQKNQAQQKSIILGRPTNTSITANILFDQNVNYFLEYGLQTGNYTNTSLTLQMFLMKLI